MGILVSGLVGSRNQKKPTPSVKIKGKVNVIRVILNPKPSFNDQKNSRSVNNPSKPMLMILYCSGKNCMPTKPRERVIEVAIKRLRLDMRNQLPIFSSTTCGISTLVNNFWTSSWASKFSRKDKIFLAKSTSSIT